MNLSVCVCVCVCVSGVGGGAEGEEAAGGAEVPGSECGKQPPAAPAAHQRAGEAAPDGERAVEACGRTYLRTT